MREVWVHNTVAKMLDNDENNLVSGRYLTVANMQEVTWAMLPTDTASGAVASFPDGADGVPIESLTVSIEPRQEGSGDPSPDNVRPISGWSAAEVTAAGKNLFNDTFKNLAVGSYTAGIRVVEAAYFRGFYVKAVGGNSYTISRKTIETNRFRIAATVEEPANNVSAIWLAKSETQDSSYSVTVTLPEDYNYIFVYLSNQADTCTDNNYQVQFGSTATAYEPYNGETITQEFRDAQGNTLTVYGGEYELVGGKLKVTRGVIDSYAGESINEPWISSLDAYTPGGTPTTGAQVVYMLAVPLEYDLSREDIRTLYGDNTIFADCGDVEVTYRADIGLYIDKKLAGQNAALTSSMNNITVLDTVKATLSKRRAK